jgi:hypothetical protein
VLMLGSESSNDDTDGGGGSPYRTLFEIAAESPQRALSQGGSPFALRLESGGGRGGDDGEGGGVRVSYGAQAFAPVEAEVKASAGAKVAANAAAEATPGSSPARGLTELASVPTRPAGYPTRGEPPAAVRQLRLLTVEAEAAVEAEEAGQAKAAADRVQIAATAARVERERERESGAAWQWLTAVHGTAERRAAPHTQDAARAESNVDFEATTPLRGV